MWFLFLFIFIIFLVISVLFFELFDIAIPNFPLSDLTSKVVSDGRTRSCSSFFDGSVDSLDLPIFVIEFILHRLLDSFNIFS